MKSEEWFRNRAKALYHEEGEIEVDENALVSTGADDGAYVEAWVWVPLDDEIEKEERKEHEGHDNTSHSGAGAADSSGD